MAEPIPDDARAPAPVDIDLNSVMNPDEITLDPGAGRTVEALMGDEVPILEDGGPDFDAYAPADGVGTHFLVLYPEVVNELNADGEWVDLPTVFRRFAGGWSIDGESFSVIFPGVLSTETPITHNTEAGSISQVPTGATASPGELRTDGSLIYRDVLASTDAVFEVAPGGFKETLVLRDAAAPTTLSWTLVVEGYDLTTAPDGSIQLVDADGAVLEMPPATIVDASKPAKTSAAPYVLSDPGDGTISMSLVLDPAFVASATYPVFVDPATATPSVLNDTYVSASAPNSTFGATNPLITGAAFSGSKRYRAFLRFATAWEQSHPLVYSAELHIKNMTEGDAAAGVQVNRASWDWGNAMTWNAMMSQPNEGVGTSPSIPNGSGATNAWWTVELKKLYQAYSYGTYPDYGFRLASTDQKKFNSVEASGTTNDPYLVVSYNDLPNTPPIDGPADTRVFDTLGGVTLALNQIPNDQNNDEVLVRYQVTGVQGDWSAGHSSGWTDATTFDVPPDWLTDGGTFFWRVQSADVCSQPEELCRNIDGAGSTVAWPATAERSFSLLAKNWGEDDRYATWSEDLGNGMSASVNEANGNMFVRVPIDRVRTPGGWLSVGLSYNSQADAEGIDRGLGSGWRLYAGPESAGAKLPNELEVLTPAPYSGVKITYRSGRHETYGWRGGSTYSMIGAGSGVVHENPDGTWTLRSADGDVFGFDTNERLSSARPVSSKPSLAGGATAFSYTFNADGNLTTLTDAIGRTARFNWADMGGTQRLDTIELWDNTTHVWDLDYTGGTLTSVVTPENETLRVFDTATCGGGLMSEIRGGQQFADGTPGWRMTYVHEGQTGYEVCRVENLFPPQAPGGTKRWLFDYGASGWQGTTSLTTKITDPRGVATTGDATDYRTIVDFNYSGLPIQIVAPKLSGAAQDWITTMVWDANGNLLCSRTPQANATAGGQDRCQGANIAHEFNTEYVYDTTAPFRVLSRTAPAPNAGAARVQTTYSHDAGPTFEGLWAEIFGGPGLGGIPKDEGLWQSLNFDWGAGSPPGLSDPDNWSVRLSGYLEVNGTEAKNVTFRVNHDDGVSLVVEDTVLLNCFGQQIADVNCGQGTIIKKKLWPGLHPITIEYQDKTGSASLGVKWDPAGGTDDFVFIPQANLVPNLGLLTSTRRDPTGGGDALALETTWAYANDDAKARRLLNAKTVTDLDPAYTGPDDARRTEFSYDEFGRMTSMTRFADKPNYAATTTRVYTDDPSSMTSCLTKLVDPTGAVMWFTCNKWGDTTEVRQVIREVTTGGETIQVAEDRITTTAYDDLGRPTRIDHPGSGVTIFEYDASGRTTEVRELIEQAPSDVWSTTTYTYDDQGTDPTMTETLPDPDGGGSLQAPVITHTFDWVGNEVTRTDPRSATWKWQTDHDAQNRVISTSSPDPDGGGPLVPLTTTTVYSVSPFTTTTTGPDHVDQVSEFDKLGRLERIQGPETAAAYRTYDALGSLIRREHKAGSTVYHWAEFTANAFGEVTERRKPWFDGTNVQDVATTYTFDAAGRVSDIDGPRPENDVRHFDYDRAGRLVLSRYWVGSSQSYDTGVIYNDAGERLQVRTQLDDAGTEFQKRRWTWTKRGLVDTSSEFHDGSAVYTTDHAYDVGGRLTSIDDPRTDCVISTTLDRLSRVTHQSGSTGCPGSLTFTYLEDGSVASARDDVSAIVYNLEYDRAARLTTLKRGAQTETTYVFNDHGQLAEVTSPAGSTAYTYFTNGPEDGKLRTVDDPVFGTGVSTYAYDAAGRLSTRTDSQGGAGIVWTRTYEPETSRVASQAVMQGTTQLGEFLLKYDESGAVTRRTERIGSNDSDPRNGSTTYLYDAAGRLKSATGPDPADLSGTTRTWHWTYDGAGNRTTEQVGGTTTTWDLDAQGWPTSSDGGTPGVAGDNTTYDWDRAGNLTSVDAPGTTEDQAFTLDAFDRITSATLGGTSVSYTLDAFSRVMTRTQGSEVTTLTYEGISEQLASSTTTSTTGTTTTSYANTPGGPLGERTGSSRMLYLRDLHDDVVGLTTDTGAITARAYYSAWGEPTWSTTTPPALGFQGQFTDPGTGFVDMTTRNYVPSLGRFASRDIVFGGLRNPVSLNQWAYAEGDPLTNTDPLGMGPIAGNEPEQEDAELYSERTSGSSSWGDSTDSGSGDPGSTGGSGSGATPPVTVVILKSLSWTVDAVSGLVGGMEHNYATALANAMADGREASWALRTGASYWALKAAQGVGVNGKGILGIIQAGGGRVLGGASLVLGAVSDVASTAAEYPDASFGELAAHATITGGASLLGGGLALAAACTAVSAGLCLVIVGVSGVGAGLAGDALADAVIFGTPRCGMAEIACIAPNHGMAYA